jgi:hypothetical protein
MSVDGARKVHPFLLAEFTRAAGTVHPNCLRNPHREFAVCEATATGLPRLALGELKVRRLVPSHVN